MSLATIEERIVRFLAETTGNSAILRNTDLIDAGIADSLTMMDLLVFIETEFSIRFDFLDLNPEVFRTPETIASLIAGRRKMAA
jgi:acyl carrier protein